MSPVLVSGNRDLLNQALGNLLDNAIKYTPDGGLITVTVIHTSTAAQLSIADNGLGIPVAERDRVLQRFVRLDQARSSAGNVALSVRLPGYTRQRWNLVITAPA